MENSQEILLYDFKNTYPDKYDSLRLILEGQLLSQFLEEVLRISDCPNIIRNSLVITRMRAMRILATHYSESQIGLLIEIMRQKIQAAIVEEEDKFNAFFDHWNTIDPPRVPFFN